MGKGGFAAALAGGLDGFVRGKMYKQRQDRDNEERELALAERQERLDDLRARRNERMALANAAAPATVNDQGATLSLADGTSKAYGMPEAASIAGSDFRQLRAADAQTGNATLATDPAGAPVAPQQAITLAGKAYPTREAADAAATAYNAPEATIERVAHAQMATDPAKAISLQNAAATQKHNAIKFSAEQTALAKKLKDEGVLEGLQALRRGDGKAMVEAFNKSGAYKIDGEPSITPEERELPGVGKIPSYTATFKMLGPDGKPRDMRINSHDLSMQLMPYEKALELQRKGVDSEAKHANQAAMLDVKRSQVEMAGQVAEARIAALNATAAARNTKGKADGTSREERLRYTTLYTEAGRRMNDTQKAISTLQRDRSFMRKATTPGTPEAEELAAAKANLASLSEERKLYQGLLAGEAGGSSASLADAEKPGKAGGKPAPAAKPAATTEPPKITSKAERDALAKGAKYRAPDGQVYIKQ